MRCTGGASESGSTTEGVVEASDAVKKLVKQLGLSTPAVLVEELLQAHVREGSAVYHRVSDLRKVSGRPGSSTATWTWMS